jgi:CRP/FNR family transcriptional regulator
MPPSSPRLTPITGPAPVISIRALRSHCENCSMRELCLPLGLDAAEMEELEAAVANRTRVRKGEALFHAGAPFASLFAVRFGSLKSTVTAEDGREQVAGYHMAGDIIGLDAIGSGSHGSDAVALEDSEVCIVPFQEIEALARTVPALQRNLHRLMSREIERDHGLMLLLGSMRAEERLAAFLLSLSERYHGRGYSASEFVLRMTREEIGSYLGLTLETVSRLFSRFRQEGLIDVTGRQVKLLDRDALRELIKRA